MKKGLGSRADGSSHKAFKVLRQRVELLPNFFHVGS